MYHSGTAASHGRLARSPGNLCSELLGLRVCLLYRAKMFVSLMLTTVCRHVDASSEPYSLSQLHSACDQHTLLASHVALVR